ncbi:MAG: PAS domain S-box protein, partial [Desulfatiglandales bacterium]
MARKPTHEELEQRVKGLEKESFKRKQAEEALREKTHLNQILLDALPCEALLLRSNREVVISNQPGRNLGAVPGKKCFATWGKRDDPCPWCLAPTALDTGETQHLEVEVLGKEWNVHWVPIGPELYLQYTFDITERKRAEEALRESEKYLAKAQEIAQVGSWAWEMHEDKSYFSDQTYRILGFKPNEIEISFKWYSGLLHPDDTEAVTKTVEESIKTHKPFDIEYRVFRKDGEEIIVYSQGEVLLDESGEPNGMMGVIQDITKRKRADEALRASEKRYRILTENVADGVGIVQDRKFQFVNTALASIFGYTVDRLVGMEPIALFRDDHKARFKELAEELEKGIPVESFQAPCIRGDGREIWVEGRHNIIEWKGKPALLVTVRDVTESKLREIAIMGEREHFQSENLKLRATLKDRYRFGVIIGKSPAMQEVYELILNASASDTNVVIYGESGTGKELIARTIHDMSDRHDKPFVPVNCGAIPEPLFESEFFGHRKGAFTGAQMDKFGFFDFAHGGTLFL